MKQEPVAWLHKPSGMIFDEVVASVEPADLIPLYTTPQYKELSDELPSPVLQDYFEKGYKCAMESLHLSDDEIEQLREYHGINDWLYETSVTDFARAILKKATNG